MRAEHFLFFNNSRIWGDDLASKYIFNPPTRPLVTLVAVRSMEVIMMLFICCLLLLPLAMGLSWVLRFSGFPVLISKYSAEKECIGCFIL